MEGKGTGGSQEHGAEQWDRRTERAEEGGGKDRGTDRHRQWEGAGQRERNEREKAGERERERAGTEEQKFCPTVPAVTRQLPLL